MMYHDAREGWGGVRDVPACRSLTDMNCRLTSESFIVSVASPSINLHRGRAGRQAGRQAGGQAGVWVGK